MASHDNNGINTASLAKNLSEIDGLTDTSNNEIREDTEILLPKYLKLNDIKYFLYEDGNVEKILEDKLPSRYQQVEYIESKGTQYIDTKFLPNYLTSVICKVNCTSGNIFGTGKGGYYSDFALTAHSSGYYRALYKKVESQTARGLDAVSVAFSSASNNTLCEIRVDKKGIFTNGILNEEFQQTYDFQSDATMCLCVFHGNKYGEREYDGYMIGKIYYFKIIDNNQLLHNFIPCYTTTTITDVDGIKRPKDTIGMYDTVTGQFHANKGTGTFGYGMEDGTYVAPQ